MSDDDGVDVELKGLAFTSNAEGRHIRDELRAYINRMQELNRTPVPRVSTKQYKLLMATAIRSCPVGTNKVRRMLICDLEVITTRKGN